MKKLKVLNPGEKSREKTPTPEESKRKNRKKKENWLKPKPGTTI